MFKVSRAFVVGSVFAIVLISGCGTTTGNTQPVSQSQTAASSAPANTPTVTVTKADVVGNWQVLDTSHQGAADEEFDLNPDGTFDEFLNHHPGFSGTWDIQNGELVLSAGQGPALGGAFTNVQRQDDQLHLTDKWHNPVTWKLIKQ